MANNTKKKEPLSTYQKLEKKYLTRMNNLFHDDKEARRIKNALLRGKNEFLRADRIESASFDMDWVERIEDCIPELGEIINNPKKTIKTVTDVVPVELAKKTNSESLRHLAQNSQYVKSIDKKGNVTPEKILNISSDDEYHTYENRFIATLVKRLVVFVEKRYDYIVKYAPFTDYETLYIKNESVVDGMKVSIETKVKVEKASQNMNVEDQSDYLKRVELIRSYVKYYLNSDFMKMFKSEKMLAGNILMTNILRKNPAYHKCLELYKFITTYNKAGVSYAIQENFLPFTKKHMEELNATTFANLLALNGNQASRIPIAKEKKYEPKILQTLDDDLFVFAPYKNVPMEFVRIDQQYLDYIDRQIAKDLKEKPSDAEKKFFEEDYKAKRKKEIEQAAFEKLKARKKREHERLKKRQEKLLEEQRLEAEKRRLEMEKQKLLERQKRLEAIRKGIIEVAKKDQKEEQQYVKDQERQETDQQDS